MTFLRFLELKVKMKIEFDTQLTTKIDLFIMKESTRANTAISTYTLS